MLSRKQNPEQKAKSEGWLEQEVDKRLLKVMQNQLKFWGKKEQRKIPEERVLITMEETCGAENARRARSGPLG